MDAARARALIDRRRAEIGLRLADVDRRLAEVRAARGDWTDEEHDPEGFALTHEWSQAAGSRARFESALRSLDQAAARVDEGTYGRCAVCGREIPAEQLGLQPERLACVACADRRARR
jgi:RNA polymerase-binding transcription factor DksA